MITGTAASCPVRIVLTPGHQTGKLLQNPHLMEMDGLRFSPAQEIFFPNLCIEYISERVHMTITRSPKYRKISMICLALKSTINRALHKFTEATHLMLYNWLALMLLTLAYARGYFHLDEIKSSLQISEDKLSLVILNWMDRETSGIAAMPWEHNTDTIFGKVKPET